MKTALVAIAKDEDHYIDEWIDYHLKLGFDTIFVYQNRWRYRGNKAQYKDRVIWFEFDGDSKQLEAYENFIRFQSNKYDWAAFFDVDEFLCLKKYDSLSQFLSKFSDCNAIGINWRMFGNSCLRKTDDYSIVKRFVWADAFLNQHIKSMLNLARCRSILHTIHFCDPHSFAVSRKENFTSNTLKTGFIHGPFNKNYSDDSVQLNHYYCKTLGEFLEIKARRGRCSSLSLAKNGQYDIEKFSQLNKNDIIDLTAKQFYLQHCKNDSSLHDLF